MINNVYIWIIIYLISAVVFSQTFKLSNRKMSNASNSTILLELFSAFFAIFFIPLFTIKISTNLNTYLILIIVVIIYAFTDRLNIESRYGIDTSVFSMLKQLSSVFLLILGIIIYKEGIELSKLIGTLLILLSNFALVFNKGKIVINKYFLMSIISNFLFAVAMLINTNISSEFNLGIYTIITLLFPSILIFIFTKSSIKELKKEYNLLNKKYFLLAAISWTIMLISSVRSYELASISLVAPLLTLTSILNSIYEFIINKDKKEFVKKMVIAILIIIGVILIKS